MLEGRPHIVDLMKDGKVQLVFNTVDGAAALTDSFTLRRTALMHKIAYYTTVAGAKASVEGIAALSAGALGRGAPAILLQDHLLASEPRSREQLAPGDLIGPWLGVDAARFIKDDQAMERVPTTAEGLKVLEDELKQLKSVERPAIIKAIAAAREHGDLSENAEYTSARERQGFIEGRIAEIEDIISRAEVIDFSKLSGKIVKFGATVQLADEDTDEKVKYQIVGPYEADLTKRPHLGDLADRPRADRQDGGRHRRGPDAARRALLRGRGRPVQVERAKPPPRRGRAACRWRASVTYWIRNSATLLAMPQIDIVADQVDRVERQRQRDVERGRAEHQAGPHVAEDPGDVGHRLHARSAAGSGSSSPAAACRRRRCSR